MISTRLQQLLSAASTGASPLDGTHATQICEEIYQSGQITRAQIDALKDTLERTPRATRYAREMLQHVTEDMNAQLNSAQSAANEAHKKSMSGFARFLAALGIRISAPPVANYAPVNDATARLEKAQAYAKNELLHAVEFDEVAEAYGAKYESDDTSDQWGRPISETHYDAKFEEAFDKAFHKISNAKPGVDLDENDPWKEFRAWVQANYKQQPGSDPWAPVT